jgi:hypothetical protein
MTSTFTKTFRNIAVAITVFGALTAASTSSFAYTAEAQQMCTGDAFRLCSSEIPNISKITACMIKNRSSLSTGCRAVMDKEASAARKSQTASVQ